MNLARRLRAVGHTVTVIGERIDEELRNEVEFVPVSVNRLTSFTRNRSFAENSARAARQRKFDIVYGLGRAFSLDAVRVTERLQCHWLDVRYRNRVNRMIQQLNPRHRTLIELERTIYHSPDVRRIVTQSKLDRKLLIDCYRVPEEKIRTVYNGVDTEAFHPRVRSERDGVRAELGVPADVPLLVFASMDFAGKGLASILTAISQLRNRDAWLLVLGTGPVRRFRRIARDLGLERRVVFAGRRSDIARCYGAGDLFLLPTAYEPFPNVNLEAMACGLPVLTTSTAGGADIVQQGGNGYLISDVHAVAEMIESLDHHLSLGETNRHAMSEQCVETARPMTIARNVQQTLEVFEEVLLEKHRV